jgi:hypothetical protein
VFVRYAVAQRNKHDDNRGLSFLFVEKEDSLERDIYIIFVRIIVMRLLDMRLGIGLLSYVKKQIRPTHSEQSWITLRTV